MSHTAALTLLATIGAAVSCVASCVASVAILVIVTIRWRVDERRRREENALRDA